MLHRHHSRQAAGNVAAADHHFAGVRRHGGALVPESIMSLKRPGVIYRRVRGAGPRLEVGLAWRGDNPSAVLRNFVALAAQSRL